MEGKIVVTPEKSTGTLTVGGFLCPTDQLADCKSQFSKAGFDVFSEHNFVTKSVQKDIAGDNTMLIYSTAVPIKDALNSLGPKLNRYHINSDYLFRSLMLIPSIDDLIRL